MRKQNWVGVCGLLILLGGCEDDKENVESTREEALADYKGRGTETCQEWQFTMCEHMTKTCNSSGVNRRICEKQYGAIECLSDASASKCVEDLLASETCNMALLTECNYDKIGDPTPAVSGCNALNNAQCERLTECEFYETVESCLEKTSKNFPCEKAVGLSADYEACMAALNKWTCTDSPISICNEVVFVAQ